MVIDMNIRESNGSKQTGRKKSRNESSQKKNKPPQRGMGIAKLEEMSQIPSLHPIPIPVQPFTNPSASSSVATSVGYSTSSLCTLLPNGGVQFRYGYPPAIPTTPLIMFNGSGSNPFGSDHVIRFENPKELSSIPNYIKCASDGCGVCHKKIRIHGGSNAVNNSRYFSGNYSGNVETVDAGKTRTRVTEYEFFPTTTWCGSGGSVGGGGTLGLRGGEGSCVTAVTGNEEGSVSSVDLSLKLSY